MTYADKVKKVIAALDGSGGYDSEEEWAEAILRAIGESDGIVVSPQNSFNTPPPTTEGSTPLPEILAYPLLQWIASHMVKFRPGINHAYFEYLDDDGCEYDLTWLSKAENPDELTMLLGCIEMAKGQNEARRRLKEKENNVS